MKRYATATMPLHSRSAVVLAAIPVSGRQATESNTLAAKLARLTSRLVVAVSAARRPARFENDESTRIALMRDGFSIDQGRFRGELPRILEDVRYDVGRQLR